MHDPAPCQALRSLPRRPKAIRRLRRCHRC
jgi:hypothetical protein